MEVNFAKMAIPDDVKEFSKRWEAGQYEHATKDFWHRLIEERAEKARTAGESLQSAYTRLIVSDPAGRALFKAYQRAPNGEPPPITKADDGPSFIMRAYSRDVAAKSAQAELERLARDYHARHSEKSYEIAFTKVMVANPALAKRASEERLAALGVA